MRSRDDIEAYLNHAGVTFSEVGPEMWVIRDRDSHENIVVRLSGPLVLFRVKVLALAEVRDRAALFEKLLRLNTEDMVHGAYGVADDAVVLTCALRVENLDYNEFQGTIDDFSLAITNHHDVLAAFRRAA